MAGRTPMALPGWIEASGLPPGVRGGCATRGFAGVSAAPFASANYGDRSADASQAVQRNRELLIQQLGLVAEPVWLRQVHGCTVHSVDASQMAPALSGAPEADACIIRGCGLAAVVQTADCVPILVADRQQSVVAAVHAGWRGLAAGVIDATLDQLSLDPSALTVWLGPAISPCAFEVGPEVRAAFVDATPAAGDCFHRGREHRWHADLYALARLRLQALGVHQVSGGHWCTYKEAWRFHSFRRDGARSGRMASLIWVE